jgi:hypothetical protein
MKSAILLLVACLVALAASVPASNGKGSGISHGIAELTEAQRKCIYNIFKVSF